MNTETTSAPLDPPVDEHDEHDEGRPVGRRRRYLINVAQQLRTCAWTTGTALALVLVLNVSLFSARQRSADVVTANVPELAPMVQRDDRLEAVLVLIASAAFLAAVFGLTLRETHRTAGAAVSVVRRLAEVEAGDYSSRVELRRRDHLHEVEAAFNRMAEALEERAWCEAEELRELAAQAAGVSGPDEAKQLAGRLLALAELREGPESAEAPGLEPAAGAADRDSAAVHELTC